MDPKILQFLLFNAMVVLFVVGYILYKPKRHVMKFRLRKPNDKAIDAMGHNIQEVSDTTVPGMNRPDEVELNVIFQFNGHSFDAFEVLGLPAGSNIDSVEKAYKQLLANCDKESREFYDFAYKAIRNR